jgi:hypothetical protein
MNIFVVPAAQPPFRQWHGVASPGRIFFAALLAGLLCITVGKSATGCSEGEACGEEADSLVEIGPNTDGNGQVDPIGRPSCVTHNPTKTELSLIRSRVDTWQQLTCPGCAKRRQRRQGEETEFSLVSSDLPLQFGVVFHVIHDDSFGKLADTQIDDQVAVLNRAFGGEADEKAIDSKVSAVIAIPTIPFVKFKRHHANCRASSEKSAV